jgi:glycosyltransferase involved in cell wall biosynthesis
MDVFTLVSLFEMMPIAVLEAMACGVPVIVNRHPVLQWMAGCADADPRTGDAGRETGAGGTCIDMSEEGRLSECLAGTGSAWIERHGKAARRRAERMFSEPFVIRRVMRYYEAVIGGEHGASPLCPGARSADRRP